MKQIAIIGIGMGNSEEVTEPVRRCLCEAQLCLGAERMLAFARAVQQGKEDCHMVPCYLPQELLKQVEEAWQQRIVLLFSGDVGFYSGAGKISHLLQERGYQVVVYPGISSLQMLCARCGKSWEDVFVVSLHGREANAAYAVRTHRKTFFLTDGAVGALAKHLWAYGLGAVKLSVGWQLSYPEERIETGTAEEWMEKCEEKSDLLACVLVENEQAQTESGYFPDERFVRREGIPMSKEVVRLLAAGSFPIAEDDILYDIGSGSGSVSVALAAKVPKGKVYAIESEQSAMALTAENARQFSMDQIVCVPGDAVEQVSTLPEPAGVFIGGSHGRLLDILERIAGESFWFVVTAVTMETLQAVMALEQREEVSSFSMRQIQVTPLRQRGRYHMFSAENPITVVSGIWHGKREGRDERAEMKESRDERESG